MIANSKYLKAMWLSRYFWLHLAFSDIRIKYRRSLLGLAWALLQPLSLTLLLAFVMGRFFHTPMSDYAPYIFSGLICWEFLVNSTVNGCTSFIVSEGYIKQSSHPLLIYTLRIVIPAFINFLCAFCGLIIWVFLWKPSNFSLSWMALFFAFPLFFLCVWPLTTITAFIGARFRDLPQFMIILFQAIYYISPIFFLPSMFILVKIGFLVEYNPIYHLLNLFRKPLLEGVFPASYDYIYVIATSVVLWIWAWYLIRRQESKIIFYL